MAIAKILLSAALVWLCFRSVDTAQTFAALGAIDRRALAGCLLFLIAHTLLSAWRWRLVCGALGMEGPDARNAVRWTALSVALSQVLPSTIGGDAYRIGALARRSGLAAATRSVVGDRLSGLWVLAALASAGAAGALFILGWVPALAAVGALTLAFFLALPALAHAGRRVPVLAKEAGALAPLLGAPAIALASLAIHLMTIGAMAALGLGLSGASGLWWQVALLTPAAMLAAAVPVSIGGWGVREGALLVGMSAFAVARADALAVSVAYGMMLLASGALGALLWAGLGEGVSRARSGARSSAAGRGSAGPW